MLILGLNAYHGDSAACLLKDGALVAAAEEERFRRVKHWAGFPIEAIRYCLGEARAGIQDLDAVAINQDTRANLWKKIGFALGKRPDISLVMDRIRNKRKRAGTLEQLRAAFPGETTAARLIEVEHHQAHLASAFLVSPFQEAVVVSVDGFGDFASAAWGHGRDNAVHAEEKVYFPHSLGIFYQAMTQYLGFPNYGDEYKVMGLAPYGRPRFMTQMRQIVELKADGTFALSLEYFRHHREMIEYEWETGEPVVGNLWSDALLEAFGPARDKSAELTQHHRDIARSAQAMYEEAFFHLLSALHRRYGGDCLALAGGCAMNSVANGKVYAKTPFRRLYLQAAAGDAGGAIGAALHASHEASDSRTAGSRRFVMNHAYWGPGTDEAEVASLLQEHANRLADAGCTVTPIADPADLTERTARSIAEGLVIGWFQGRMEWGPRALGNRSILADPRRADMKDILNRKIKRRESFRPFAPSIMREAVPDWFEVDDDVPFMMQVYPIREEKRALIPAVTHVDGSGRLQTVTREANPLYYGVIESFAAQTGVPIVLNTSFNENEPVVCRPQEALDCFMRTSMDVLVLGRQFISRGR